VKLFSTEEAAKQVGVSYTTLRRWLAAAVRGHRFHSQLKSPGSVSIGTKQRKRIWRWTPADIEHLKEHSDLFYSKGRGRTAPMSKKDAARARNAWKAEKRMWSFIDDPTRKEMIAREKARRAAYRRYEKSLKELRKHRLRPRDSQLIYIVEGK